MLRKCGQSDAEKMRAECTTNFCRDTIVNLETIIANLVAFNQLPSISGQYILYSPIPPTRPLPYPNVLSPPTPNSNYTAVCGMPPGLNNCKSLCGVATSSKQGTKVQGAVSKNKFSR